MKRILLLVCFAAVCTPLLQAQSAVKKVIVEEFTGAWCGWCPDGRVVLDQIEDSYGDQVIIASYHNGDFMVTSNGNQVVSFYTNAFPTAVIDRRGDAEGRSSWTSAVASELSTSSPVSVSLEDMSYNAQTNMLDVTVRATFVQDYSGTMRMNLIITEDSVVGSGTGYDQVNYTNTSGGHPYQGAGDPIVGYDHPHVVRDMKGGAWGTASVIPASVTAGEEFTVTYSHYVNANHVKENFELIGMVSLFEGSLTYQRKVLNVEAVDWATATALQESESPAAAVTSYPNPFSDRLTFTFELEHTAHIQVQVFDAMGRLVKTMGDGMMNQGMHSLYWNGRDEAGNLLSDGVYMIRLSDDQGRHSTQRVLLQR